MTKLPKILYIEDDAHLRFPISEILKLMGYDVATADNGKLGIEKAEVWKPDFILTDLRMPVMDGREAIRVYAASLPLKTSPFMYCQPTPTPPPAPRAKRRVPMDSLPNHPMSTKLML